jgi:hypothetical protein
MKLHTTVLAGILLATAASARDITVSPGDSLTKARDEAKSGDRIVLHGGAYRLSETLVLGPQNSGVTWMAFPGEKPVISGGAPVTGWTPDTNGIWKAKLDHKGKIRQLYVNDKPATMAMSQGLKLYGWRGTFTVKGDEPWAADGADTAPDGIALMKADLPAMRSNPSDLEFLQKKNWMCLRLGIRGIQGGDKQWTMLFEQPAAAIASKFLWGCELDDKRMSYLANAYEYISKPGDFYYNTATGWLYYKPRAGEDMSKAEAVVPQLETLVLVKGESLKSHAEHIRFQGLTFAHTAYAMMKMKGCDTHGNVGIQSSAMTIMFKKNKHNWHSEPWGLYTTTDLPPAAVLVTSAGDVSFQRNVFRLLGCMAVNLENDVAGAEVSGNVFQYAGGPGVDVGHPQHSYIGKQNGDNYGWGPYNIDNSHDKWDETVEGLPMNILVANNLFRNTCTELYAAMPITVYDGHFVSVLHNDIKDAPWSGITCGWNWSECNGLPNCGNKKSEFGKKGGKPSMSMHQLKVNYNRVVNPGQVLVESVNIYFVGELAIREKKHEKNPAFQDDFAEMRGNYMVANATAGTNWLIGCDEGTSYLRIEENVLDGNVSGIDSVLHRKTGDRGKTFMNNWLAAAKMEDECDFADKNVFVGMNHFVERPPKVNLTKEQWPAEAQAIIERSGLEPPYADLWQKLTP